MNSFKLAYPISVIAALLYAGCGTAEARDTRPSDQTQIKLLVQKIVEAGSDTRPLDRQRVEALFGLQTKPECYDFVSSQGHVYSCRYRPISPQTAPVQFVEYLTSRLGPGPMSGGNIDWKIDPSALCLTKRDLEFLFGFASERARFPTMPDFLGGAAPVRVDSYDFTLVKKQPEDNYVAVYEVNGCVDRLHLSTY